MNLYQSILMIVFVLLLCRAVHIALPKTIASTVFSWAIICVASLAAAYSMLFLEIWWSWNSGHMHGVAMYGYSPRIDALKSAFEVLLIAAPLSAFILMFQARRVK